MGAENRVRQDKWNKKFRVAMDRVVHLLEEYEYGWYERHEIASGIIQLERILHDYKSRFPQDVILKGQKHANGVCESFDSVY